MKQAKVNLINFTPQPIETMIFARKLMHENVPDYVKSDMTKKEQIKYFKEILLKDGMPTFLEYVNLVFKLENVSRSLQQQLTRHRIGFSFSIQSLRCIDLPKFAENYDYYNPYKEQTEEHNLYHHYMLKQQDIYNKILGLKFPIQDARGFLPLNVFSTITFSCSLRALIGMVNKRLCLKTQGEFQKVADLIVKEVGKALGPEIVSMFKRPCDYGKCMMEAENAQQLKEKKLTGQQNTQYCCPIYRRKNDKNKRRNFKTK